MDNTIYFSRLECPFTNKHRQFPRLKNKCGRFCDRVATQGKHLTRRIANGKTKNRLHSLSWRLMILTSAKFPRPHQKGKRNPFLTRISTCVMNGLNHPLVPCNKRPSQLLAWSCLEGKS